TTATAAATTAAATTTAATTTAAARTAAAVARRARCIPARSAIRRVSACRRPASRWCALPVPTAATGGRARSDPLFEVVHGRCGSNGQPELLVGYRARRG